MSNIIKQARIDCIKEYGCNNQKDKLEKLFDQMIEM